jgi:hypothetical protein
LTAQLQPVSLAGYGDTAAWSVYDPLAGRYRLVVRRGGRTSVAPVPPNRRPFDIDLGPGPVAVYSRCAPRCRLFRYDITRRRETALHLLGRHPASWRGTLAYARAGRVHVGTVAIAAPRELGRGTGVAALDVRPPDVAVVWALIPDDVGWFEELRVYDLRGRPLRRNAYDYGGGGLECDTLLAAPALTRGGLRWLHSRLGNRPSCGRGATVRRRPLAPGSMEEATVMPGAVAAAFGPHTVTVSAPQRYGATRAPCAHGDGCRLRRLRPRWRPRG